MPSSASRLRRSPQTSVHRLSAAIQRLTSARQLSSTTQKEQCGEKGNPHRQSSNSSSQSNPIPRNGSILKWATGLTIGTGLGGLYHHSCDDDDQSIFSIYNKSSSSVAFADWSSSPAAVSTSDDSLSDKKTTKFLFGDEYRRKVFFNYEKRIRLRSPPEKVYEYFATFTNSDGEVFMTAADLMRAVVPVFPPSESHLIRDGYLRGEKSPGNLCCAPSEFFMLFDVDTDGLISFKEYIFFVTLLSIPESSFSVAFKMFDNDGNGEIDKEEFKKVMTLMRAANRQGSAQRDGLRAGVNIGGSVENGGLVEYFFGKHGTERLHHDKFVQFLRDLQNEILRLEFCHYDRTGRGSICAKDFALSMVASADIKHVNKLLDRVGEIDNDISLRKIRISEDEFRKFADLRKKLEPLAWALFSFGEISGFLTKEDFQRAAAQICDVHLSDNVVNIIFHVFDANQDGSLSIEEFIKVMERREKDIAGIHVEDGIFSRLSCCWNCAKKQSSISRLKLDMSSERSMVCLICLLSWVTMTSQRLVRQFRGLRSSSVKMH